jgi:hypothetical protein
MHMCKAMSRFHKVKLASRIKVLLLHIIAAQLANKFQSWP